MWKFLAVFELLFCSLAQAQTQQRYVTATWPQVNGYTDGGQMTAPETANLSYDLYTMPANDTDFADDSVYEGTVWAWYCTAVPAPCTYQFWIYSFRPCVVVVTFDPAIDLSQQGASRSSAPSKPVCVTFP